MASYSSLGRCCSLRKRRSRRPAASACTAPSAYALGGLLFLEQQDRALWDEQHIEPGLEWLAKSARGDRFSRSHAEAHIAAEHCLVPSFAATRWDRVAECYALLERFEPSPIHALNRAVAVAEWQGPACIGRWPWRPRRALRVKALLRRRLVDMTSP